jgi:hypothetical protein
VADLPKKPQTQWYPLLHRSTKERDSGLTVSGELKIRFFVHDSQQEMGLYDAHIPKILSVRRLVGDHTNVSSHGDSELLASGAADTAAAGMSARQLATEGATETEGLSAEAGDSMRSIFTTAGNASHADGLAVAGRERTAFSTQAVAGSSSMRRGGSDLASTVTSLKLEMLDMRSEQTAQVQ